ncbi:SAM-dependent methyltransferase [Methanobacterium alcaliphilum]|uniref:SAM-dependent methyltransferase n=1 Tax=Methanobacterium alcaliphilum TaxID=392018 RepID=UPI00200A237F|nr:class I SAM-dependent methyltransferase [Methanobacterium alcaliphilum]MCK9150829.1 class I SAM-dependent methyltransferase [Methanobacterium alcaliphilum]
MENEIIVNRESPSKMAEGIAMQRFAESSKSENERICYDPYAIHFISPEIIKFGKEHPEEAKLKVEQMEQFLPGLSSSIIARVRYFDDFVEKSIKDGLEQLVILGAGYDTRAYRIDGLKEKINVFEVDHPNTQSFKIKKIKEIFGSTPKNVTYVPVDFESEELGERLLKEDYDPFKKTLFIMEGLIMYIPEDAVEKTLSFIVKNSYNDSSLIFDYYPESVIDGTCNMEIGNNIRNYLFQMGEPLQFGIAEGRIEEFLKNRGFSQVRNISSEDYKNEYFNDKNQNRDVCSLLSLAHAVI